MVAFSVVAIGVLVLRRTQPDLERPFRVPGYPVTPLPGGGLRPRAVGSGPITWLIFGVWLLVVLAFYLLLAGGTRVSTSR